MKGINDWKRGYGLRSFSVKETFSDSRIWFVLLLFQLILIIFYLTISLSFTPVELGLCRPTELSSFPSPVKDAIGYETRYFRKYSHFTSVFSRPPGPAVDMAWHNLLEGMNIRITEKDLHLYNVTSLPLKDGSGFVAQLGMYHELHCLKKMKRWIYKDYYYPRLSTADDNEEHAHLEHCLELLRMAALCRGDTTLTTFAWSNHTPPRLETEYPVPHKCVDTKKLFAWSKARSVELSEIASPT